MITPAPQTPPAGTPIVKSLPGRPAHARIERLLFPEEVADWLGVSKRFVLNQARDKKLGCVKVADTRQGVRFDAEDVRSYIESCRQHPGQSHSRRRIAGIGVPLRPRRQHNPKTQKQT